MASNVSALEATSVLLQSKKQKVNSGGMESGAINEVDYLAYAELVVSPTIATLLGQESTPIGTAQVSGVVWRDAWLPETELGIREEPNDELLVGVGVRLYQNGQLIATTVSDQNGFYQFKDLLAGDYQLGFDAPAFTVATTMNVGGDEARDSDIQRDGMTDIFTLGSDQHLQNLDAGFLVRDDRHALAKLNGSAWLDLDRDGKQDLNEVGLANVKVRLLDKNGKRLAETVTNADGQYLFKDLNAGEYQLYFAKPAGMRATLQDATIDSADSDIDGNGYTALVKLEFGGENNSVDAGFVYSRASTLLSNSQSLDVLLGGATDSSGSTSTVLASTAVQDLSIMANLYEQQYIAV